MLSLCVASCIVLFQVGFGVLCVLFSQRVQQISLQQLQHLEERLVLDATGNKTMQLAIYAVSKHEDILKIIATGAEAIFKPLKYVQLLNKYTGDARLIQMEVARSYYTIEQLTSLNQYLLDTYRKDLAHYNFTQRTTIMENISRHLCYANINEFSV